MVIIDLISDSNEGAQSWHLMIEALMGFWAVIGILVVERTKS